MRAARALLAHPSALSPISTVTSGPRAGTLASADGRSHTVFLYVRSCTDESTAKLAVAWMYEAGQFVNVAGWDTATQNRWRQLRGAALSSVGALRQDVAAVFAYWQTGTSQWWRSAVAPPSPSQLPSLAPFLHLS